MHALSGIWETLPKHKQVVPKTLAIDREHKSRQIAANRGKFHSENNGDHFLVRFFHYMVISYRDVMVTAPIEWVQILSRSIECHWTM